MGQQQLLYVVLAAIIIGLAITVGIQFMRSEMVILREGQVEQIMLETAESFQAWHIKPTAIGGGGHSWGTASFDSVSCSLGQRTRTTSGSMGCTTDDREVSLMLRRQNDHLNLVVIAHIGGDDSHHLYSRTLRIYADSLAWEAPWTHF